MIYLIGIGADIMVAGAVSLARRLGVSSLVIGLTVIAFGTSAPELAASVLAGLRGSGEIAVANVIGSNLFNLCFILGGVALLSRRGIAIDRALLWRDGPVALLAVVVLFLTVGGLPGGSVPAGRGFWFGPLDFRLELIEAILLVLLLIAYTWFVYRRQSRRHTREPLAERAQEIQPHDHPPLWRDIILFAAGLALVLAGSQILVGARSPDGAGYGALWLATALGVPEYIIGVTIVAAGTSAPELVVSLTAARRGHGDIATGNLLGSTIFNVFAILGVAGIVAQPPLAPAIDVASDTAGALLAQCILLVLLIIFMLTERRLSRLEGSLLVLIGVAHWVVDFVTRGR